jgi:hypothetical protein
VSKGKRAGSASLSLGRKHAGSASLLLSELRERMDAWNGEIKEDAKSSNSKKNFEI